LKKQHKTVIGIQAVQSKLPLLYNFSTASMQTGTSVKHLTDTFQRTINYLRISITDRCNLRCVYCMPPEGVPALSHEAILSYEEIVRIVRVAAGEGIKKVRITGGEPLVRKGVVGLVALLSKVQGIQDLSMTTNGILLADYAQPLFDAGLMRVNVSMDSLMPQRFREITRGGELSQVLKGIETAESVGLKPIKINVVAIKGYNESEIIDFVRLTIDHDYHIRFIEFMPVGHENGWRPESYLSGASIMQCIESHFSIERIAGEAAQGTDGPADLFRMRGARGVIGFINAISNHFCASCNRLRLTADGKLRPCLFSDVECDVRTVLRSGGSDAELKELLHTALSSKPKKHALFEPSFRKCVRDMVSIGG
jgi:cyclic pyranopterin phosphate synthase